MAAQMSTGRASWIEVKKITIRGLMYKRWDDGIDPYVELNDMVKTGVIWNGRGRPHVWTRTDSVVPVSPGENELHVKVYDAHRVRDDVFIGECTVDTTSVPDMVGSPTVLRAQVSCPKFKDAQIELHLIRSSGASFPEFNEPEIRADHRKISVEDLDISSDIKKPRDLREEAKRLALEAKKKETEVRSARAHQRHESYARTDRKEITDNTPAPPRKESQPRRESKLVTEVKPVKHVLPPELTETANRNKNKKNKTRTMSPGWLEKNVEAEKKLVIDDAYNESYKKIVHIEGVHLNSAEIAIILNALGYHVSKAPSVPTKSYPGVGDAAMQDAPESLEEGIEGQKFLKQGIVHIPLSETTRAKDIAALLTELVHKVDFGIVGTHKNIPDEASETSQIRSSCVFAISDREAKIIMDHLLSLITGMWTRIRNFILLVCGSHPDQGGGRPSNWSISWIQKLARKLNFPEDKFMSCNGVQFLEENRNVVKHKFGIVPSLLQTRFALYQHVLRLIESWWTIPSRPSDRVDSTFKETRKQSVSRVAPGGFVAYAPPTAQKPSKRRPGSSTLTSALLGRKEVHRLTLSPTYVKKGQRPDDLDRDSADKLDIGDSVVIGPKLILFPAMLAAGHDNDMDVRDHMFEKYSEMVAGRSGVVSVFPYGRHVFPDMIWVALKPEEEDGPQEMSQLVKQLEKVDITDILVSGRHVFVPVVCVMRIGEVKPAEPSDEVQAYRRTIGNDFETIGLDRKNHIYVSKLEADAQNRLADAYESNWRDDYSEDSQPAFAGDPNYPDSPEYYIGGGLGVHHAVVTAPLPISVQRKPRPSSAPSYSLLRSNHAEVPPHKSMLSQLDPVLRESADGQWETLWSQVRGGTTNSPGSNLGRPRSLEDYPTPEKYINGGKGVKKAIVIAPLENPVPNRTNHEKLPGSPERDRSADRPLYRPLPNFFDTVIPGSDILRPRSCSSGLRLRPINSVSGRYEAPSTQGDHFGEAQEVLKLLSRGLDHKTDSSNMKESVRASVDRYNKLDNQFRGSMKKNKTELPKPQKRRNSFDPLKEPVSSRPKPDEKKKKKPKKWSDAYASEQDEELLKLVEKLENINEVDELQDIQDSLAGHFRKRSAKGYGSPVRDPKGVYPDGIIDSMIKYKLNHDGDSNSAKLKMQKWGVSNDQANKKPKKSVSDIENIETDINKEKVEAPVPLKKDKFIFPWMIGEPRTSDEIDPRKNERLWRALKVAERETSKKEAHLRKQLRRLGVADENMVVKDPYDAYSNV